MAYQLDHRSQGASAHASVPAWSTSASAVWSIEFEIEVFSLSSTIALGGATYAARVAQITTAGTVTCQNSGGGTVLTSAAGAVTVGVNTIKVERTSGGLWQLTVNGVSVSTSSTAAAAPMTYLANRVQNSYTNTNIAIMRVVTSGGAYSTSWDGTNAPSTGTTWTSSGGQVATLNNFTGVTDSWWVFYSSGATYQLTAQGGAFAYSGQTAALNRGFKLAAQGGTYSYAGASANLSYTTATIYRLDALGASYSYTGASASLLRGFVLDAHGGAYSYAGSDAVLRRGFKLAANGCAYSYAGADASLTYVAGPIVYRLTALGVTYVYSGADASLTATGVTPAANPAAFVNRAHVGVSEVISAQVGGRLTNSAKIGGSLTNNATVAI